MTAALESALDRLPRKGEVSYPLTKRWRVAENVHDWALMKGYLTGAVFYREGSRGSRRYRLLLVGPCPWVKGRLRYYTASLPTYQPPEPLAANGG